MMRCNCARESRALSTMRRDERGGTLPWQSGLLTLAPRISNRF